MTDASATGVATSAAPTVSVVTCAYCEQGNVEPLYRRVAAALDAAGESWELIVVDDHSTDRTFAEVQELRRKDPRVRGLRLARNSGSHAARRCGLQHARGRCVVSLAADLQDPPEKIPELIERWRRGAQVVVAVRSSRRGERWTTRVLSSVYGRMMAALTGVGDPAVPGAGFLLLDRRAVVGLLSFSETRGSVLALASWMGYRRDRVAYDQAPRTYGRSGWTLRKKVTLFADSITSFTLLPVRMLTAIAAALVACGVLGLGASAVRHFGGGTTAGWQVVAAIVLVVGGLQMVMIGVVGEYVWRTLEEARRRPPYLVEERIGFEDPPP